MAPNWFGSLYYISALLECIFGVVGNDPLTVEVVEDGGDTRSLLNSADGDVVDMVWEPILQLFFWTTSKGEIYLHGEPFFSSGVTLGGIGLDVINRLLFISAKDRGILRVR